MGTQRILALTACLCLTVIAGACQKQESQSPPAAGSTPTPSASEDQSASISVDPSNIPVGESATLTWRTTNASDVSINGIGTVQTRGLMSVSPQESTIYHLIAKGAGGTLHVTTQLTVRKVAVAAPSR